MPRKVRDLKRDLRRAGFSQRPGKGSHTVWSHSLLPDNWTMSGNDSDDARHYQEREVRDLIRRAREAEEGQSQ
ncbi:MAG: type II toxin-antitoxin system HicA family toxin [Chloroflexota bacterium]|nr:type II toxin-antitoxin system HicA family toxin [Chloroflexota bacterium]